MQMIERLLYVNRIYNSNYGDPCEPRAKTAQYLNTFLTNSLQVMASMAIECENLWGKPSFIFLDSQSITQ